jgi:hypothetical protein
MLLYEQTRTLFACKDTIFFAYTMHPGYKKARKTSKSNRVICSANTKSSLATILALHGITTYLSAKSKDYVQKDRQ